MEPLQIKPTNITPTINFDGEKGICEIKGRSSPSNTIEFYKALHDFIDEYSKAPTALTEVNIQFDYFNTSTSKCILTAFKKFETMYRAKNEVIINWYYEKGDEDMLEAGSDFQSIIHLPFKFIEVPG
jgi:hypothetical protein